VGTERSAAGYLPIGGYAAVGDGRTVALVGIDGSIDWLCVPNLDSASVFGRLLDAGRGGAFELAPVVPYEATRTYVGETNVLETIFETGEGVVRVTDAMTFPRQGLAPGRELVRRIEGLAGTVPLRWRVAPRFGYGLAETRLDVRDGRGIATAGADAISVSAWGAGDPHLAHDTMEAGFELQQGTRALLVLGVDHQEPLVFPDRDGAEARLELTQSFWERWSSDRTYDGPWRDEVIRSALALKLLVFAPSGAVAAASTTSLPETPGGARNWDYRYSWIRDASFVLDTLAELGCDAETHAFLWWMLHASQRTHPRLQVLYALDGGPESAEKELPLMGYEGARPVRIGNGAAEQRQLDVYGDLFEAVWRYVQEGHELDRETGRRLAKTADLVTEIWRGTDSGIWEVRGDEEQFTQSKVMCWVALDRSCRLAAEGRLPDDHAGRWRREAAEIRRFVQERCWSDEKQSYTRSAESEELDASILLAPALGFGDASDARLCATIDAVRRELAEGPLVWRYRTDDSLEGEEGAFLACSFWMVNALAAMSRRDEAGELMEELLPLANDLGLYSEEISADGKTLLGNFPQALTHLALIGAALAVEREGGGL
jgi:GH15 family glucan-1,4-alpha-glucosidase